MSKIRRLEIAFDEAGEMQGAQVTLDDGTSRGLDLGRNPEYESTLADALGDTAAQLLKDHGRLTEDKRRLEQELEAKEEQRGKLEAEKTGQAAQIKEALANIEQADAAFRHIGHQLQQEQGKREAEERLVRKNDEVSALAAKLLTKD